MNLDLIVSAFSFIFLAALPGRTTFVMTLIATREKPLPVFLGAALAFAAQSLISVALGHLLAFMPPSAIQAIAGLLFLYFAYCFWKEAQHPVELKTQTSGSWRSAFILVFAAEWGDVSQVAIATFAARNADSVSVFISAVAALWLIAALAIGVGYYLGRKINPGKIQKIAAVAFALTGIYLLLTATIL